MDIHPPAEPSDFHSEGIQFDNRHAFSEHCTDLCEVRDPSEAPHFINASQINHRAPSERAIPHGNRSNAHGIRAPSEPPRYLGDGHTDHSNMDISCTRGAMQSGIHAPSEPPRYTSGGSQQRAPNNLNGHLVDTQYAGNCFPSDSNRGHMQPQVVQGIARPSTYHSSQAITPRQDGHDPNGRPGYRQEIVYPTFDRIQEEIIPDSGPSSRDVVRRDIPQDIIYAPGSGSSLYPSTDNRGDANQAVMSYQPASMHRSPYPDSESATSSTTYTRSSSSIANEPQLRNNMAT
ncbi:hypothetical protein BJ138DRAFT_1121044 [Hygrophoropsis aurantiaca]|uniref:Uncharacterized protein n=1 Tax=Hygrophoropsis aurantiaca TaxID=72124 RepID=A0ACB7ZNT5_9AGAM|nr:hypothetical protein BJ138DRAFT_1121044 [Hygrophoropsis aurantiaca]